MGLFDAIREKAGELLSGATEKVGDLAGDLPGAQEAQEFSQTATDAAGQTGEQVAGTAEELGATATGAAGDLTGSVGDAADTVTGSLPDLPPEPYRP